MISLKSIIFVLAVILAFHSAAFINHWYWTIWWFDIPMHFSGGLWLAMIFFYLTNPRLKIASYQTPFTFLFALGFVALGGVAWELAEFLYDVFISSRGYFGIAQLGAVDTVGDLFFDLCGGLALSFIYFFVIQKSRKNKESFL
ncbi:MAG: hypothetical protein AAB498_00600 [Patescibacteria group bacterium]